MISNLFYYILYTSAVLIYGIGINRATVVCEKPEHIVLFAVKMLISVCSASVLTYLLIVNLFVPVHLAEIYPFIAVLIFSAISVFIESLVRITAKTSTAEFALSLLSVLISVNESTSVIECLLISCFCTLSFYLFIPFLYAIQKRIEISRPSTDFRNSSLIIISISIVIIALVAWNVSWLNPEVFQ